MDLDLAAIQDQMEIGSKVGMETAERIYREGAFSHPVAQLQLDTPLSQDIPRGTSVSGVAFSSAGGEVVGRSRDFWPMGATEVLVEYAITADQQNVRDVGDYMWTRLRFCDLIAFLCPY